MPMYMNVNEGWVWSEHAEWKAMDRSDLYFVSANKKNIVANTDQVCEKLRMCIELEDMFEWII